MKAQVYLAVYQGGTLWLDGVKKRKQPEGVVAAMQGRERCYVEQKEDGSWMFYGEEAMFDGARDAEGRDEV
jgi:hypothetical protein